MTLPRLFKVLPCVAILLQACGTPQSRGIAGLYGKRDACSFIQGRQYPFDWEGSNVGACIKKLPPQAHTVMVPDPIGGLFQVPETVWKDNLVSISSPVGEGVGEFNGNYVVGMVSTLQGTVEFVCAGLALTGASRGVCGLR